MIRVAREADLPLSRFVREVYVPSKIRVSEGWAEQIRWTVQAIEAWRQAEVWVSELSEPLIRRFLADHAQNHASATVNSRRGTLLALWHLAWEEGYLPEPPRRTRVRRLPADERVPEAWTASELGSILRACQRCRGAIHGIPAPAYWRSILLTAYDTGARRSELLALAPAQVKIDTATVIFVNTKTHRQRWYRVSCETICAVRVIYGDRPRLWPWLKSIRSLDDRLNVILSRAGVRHGRASGGVWHKFRRTSGTLVEEAGGDGAKHLGNTRAVFERHYRDPSHFSSSVDLLPRPS